VNPRSILSPDFTIPGQWSSPMPRSEIEAMLAVPVRRRFERMGADDFRKPRPLTAEQIRGVE